MGIEKDIDRPLSFEQDADDVAALLKQLRVQKADFMGFSNGATTCIQVAIRHPNLVNKLVLASATYKRSGMPLGFFDGFKNASLKMMSRPLQEAYLKANPDPKGLQSMFDRDVARMAVFKDINDSEIKSIQAPTLVLNGDSDVVLFDMRLNFHAHYRMHDSPFFQAFMSITLEKLNLQTRTASCQFWLQR